MTELAVTRVLLDYATAIDTKDWGLFRDCFASDCTMTTTAGTISGVETLTRHMEDLHAPLDASLHRITNVVVSIAGDRATARAYLEALLVQAGHADGPTFRVAGVYDDELVRLAGDVWVIRARAFSATWREGNPGVLSTPPVG